MTVQKVVHVTSKILRQCVFSFLLENTVGHPVRVSQASLQEKNL